MFLVGQHVDFLLLFLGKTWFLLLNHRVRDKCFKDINSRQKETCLFITKFSIHHYYYIQLKPLITYPWKTPGPKDPMYLVRETQFYFRFHFVSRQNIITLCTRAHVHGSAASMHGYCLECARGVGGIAVCVAVRRRGAASLFHFVGAALPVACHVRFRGDSRVEVNDK